MIWLLTLAFIANADILCNESNWMMTLSAYAFTTLPTHCSAMNDIAIDEWAVMYYQTDESNCWRDYTLTLTINMMGGDNTGIAFRSSGPGTSLGHQRTGYELRIKPSLQTAHLHYAWGTKSDTANIATPYSFPSNAAFNLNTNYNIKISIIDYHVQIYWENIKIFNYFDSTYKPYSGTIGLQAHDTTFSNVTIHHITSKEGTNDPTKQPTNTPSKHPTNKPSSVPTNHPSIYPTTSPTLIPTEHRTTFGISYLYENNICNNLYENIQILYEVSLNQCVFECEQIHTNCRMINYFNYVKTNNDSRCYIFDKLCHVKVAVNNNNNSIIGYKTLLTECVDYPYDWTDHDGDSCHYYESFNWCNDGALLKDENEFDALSDITYGLTAIETCCECNGDVQRMDDVLFSYDNDWSDAEAHILCKWVDSDFTLQLAPQTTLRNWDNLVLYELCNDLESIDCTYLIDSQFQSTQYEYSLIICNDQSQDHEIQFSVDIIVDDFQYQHRTYINPMWFNLDSSYYSSNINISFVNHVDCISDIINTNDLNGTYAYGIHICSVIDTTNPTTNPTFYPTLNPTIDPTLNPSVNPKANIQQHQILHPTFYPTLNPTIDPTLNPSVNPKANPTFYPTLNPASNHCYTINITIADLLGITSSNFIDDYGLRAFITNCTKYGILNVASAHDINPSSFYTIFTGVIGSTDIIIAQKLCTSTGATLDFLYDIVLNKDDAIVVYILEKSRLYFQGKDGISTENMNVIISVSENAQIEHGTDNSINIVVSSLLGILLVISLGGNVWYCHKYKNVCFRQQAFEHEPPSAPQLEMQQNHNEGALTEIYN
eukprot:173610_1